MLRAHVSRFTPGQVDRSFLRRRPREDAPRDGLRCTKKAPRDSQRGLQRGPQKRKTLKTSRISTRVTSGPVGFRTPQGAPRRAQRSPENGRRQPHEHTFRLPSNRETAKDRLKTAIRRPNAIQIRLNGPPRAPRPLQGAPRALEKCPIGAQRGLRARPSEAKDSVSKTRRDPRHLLPKIFGFLQIAPGKLSRAQKSL